jgi:hypothetical protein
LSGGKNVIVKVAGSDFVMIPFMKLLIFLSINVGKDATKQFNMFHKPSVLIKYGPKLGIGSVGSEKKEVGLSLSVVSRFLFRPTVVFCYVLRNQGKEIVDFWSSDSLWRPLLVLLFSKILFYRIVFPFNSSLSMQVSRLCLSLLQRLAQSFPRQGSCFR